MIRNGLRRQEGQSRQELNTRPTLSNMYSDLLMEPRIRLYAMDVIYRKQTEDEDRRLGVVGCHDGSEVAKEIR